MKFLFFPPIGGEWLQRIHDISSDIELYIVSSEDEAFGKIPEMDAFFGRMTPTLLQAAKKLRWIQAPSIGLEGYIFPELAESSVVLTNMRGVFSDHIADHVFAYILCFARGLHRFIRRQMEHLWVSESEVPVIYLPEQTIGIIGLGGIGSEVARRATAFGMRIIAVDPRREDKPDYIEALWRPDRLYDLLRESDFVVICAPHTKETEGMFGQKELNAMKRTAYLINIGRGKIVKLDALVKALQEGQIAGAGLDVFETEPLPTDSLLWDMENVIITPHTAGIGPYIDERRMGILLENVKRFVSGEPLMNVVDKEKWF